MEKLLVDDCLSNVMDYLTLQTLDRVSLVNKRWYSISRTHMKWSTVLKNLSDNNKERSIMKRDQVQIYRKVGYMCDICNQRICTYGKVNKPPQPYIDERTKDRYSKICNSCFYSETMHQLNKYMMSKRLFGFPDIILQHLVHDNEFLKGVNFEIIEKRLEKRLCRYHKLRISLARMSLCLRTDSRMMWTYILKGKPNFNEVLHVAYETNKKFIAIR